MEYVKRHLEHMDNEDDESGDKSLLQLLLKSCSTKDACVVAVDSMAAGIDTVSKPSRVSL